MDININLHIYLHQPDRPTATADHRLLSAVAARQLEQARQCRSASTLGNYLTAMRSFRRYVGGDIPLSAIDATLLQGYERWLRAGGRCPNTVSCYMRSLRALLSPADGRLRQAFCAVYTGSARTDKRSVPTDVVGRLMRLTLPEGSFTALARDVFLFCFMAMGMPFVDAAHLRRTQVSGDRLVYFRQKTGQRISVTLEAPMQRIISRYSAQSATAFVFPLLSSDSPAEYPLVLARYNRHLRRLGTMVGSPIPLTSYVARHSWASAAYAADVGLAVISKALGHASARTTQTYLRELDDRRTAEANRDMLDAMLAK